MMSSRWKWGVRTLIFNFADFFLTRVTDLINKERLLVVLLNLKSKHLLKMNLSSWIRLNFEDSVSEFPFCNLAWPQWNTKIGCVSVRSQSCTTIVWCIIATKSIKTVTIRNLFIFFFFRINGWKISLDSIFVRLQSVRSTVRKSAYWIDEFIFIWQESARRPWR